MTETLLQTKLFIPPLRPNLVPRPQLIEWLNQGLQLGHKLTLISAPAGFGKTTLASEWLAGCERPSAWLSLDEGDNDPTRFLAYFIAALQTLALSEVEGIAPNIGEGVLAVLQSPQRPPTESILTALLNEITTTENFVLVLDDYHVVDAKSIDNALTFLLEHLPPQLHLVIATREDPNLPLARLRASDQLTELRVSELRFTHSEVAAFLNKAMDLDLSEQEINALENRTEGWIVGLQLAALSMRGHKDTPGFIKSFTGSHHFVLDYLVEEVLQQQPQSVQTFLLRTSILDRLCGPLCEAVLLDPSTSGQETLEYLQRNNLFIVRLDDERRWYRYHHLFADLLRQRLQQRASSMGNEWEGVDELHGRASQWYEDNGLDIEAFRHAAAANDVDRAERLIAGEGVPLQYRGAAATVLNWLATLPTAELDARPSLWVTYAAALNLTGHQTAAEQKLQAAMEALESAGPNGKTRDIIGHIAAIRAMMAVGRHELETIITQSQRALEYLHPDNLTVRTITTWTLGLAYQLQGDRAAASRAYTEVMSISQASGDIISTLAATTGLGNIQETENQLFLAAESYRHGDQLFGDPPQPVACGVYLGLAGIFYEWNDLDAAGQKAQLSLQLAQQVESIDTPALCWVLLARLELAHGNVAGAAAMLSQAEQFVRRHNHLHRMPEIAAVQVQLLLKQGDLAQAAHLAQKHELPISQVRVHLAQGETSAALSLLEPLRQQAEAKGWENERLQVVVLQAVARHAHGEKELAVQLLDEALVLAEPGGLIRTFLDEGEPMAQLISAAANRGIMPDYTGKLLAAFEAERHRIAGESPRIIPPSSQPLIEPLSQRELEILHLIAQGLSNREIGERLFLALDTVKGHNHRIFGKLQVHRRTEAVARARELGLL